eukprot:TRINITY_DN1951_c0_g1_i4.p1 TRINITY_DN1951_c0_g1~~TRINITY_DN1951_c0_g1_i4.p1  ORF type:complete len:384 (+),score=45.55 TRINITY_DN1951_c0_g1_i4:172-1323(+)
MLTSTCLLVLLFVTTSFAQYWASCASEGGYCNIPPLSRAIVRYGKDKTWTYKELLNTGIPCNNGPFGDPAPGIQKECDYVVIGPAASDNGTWIDCATEGAWCGVPGVARVRYGYASEWTYRIVEGGVACHNGIFGDPYYGAAKACQYSSVPSYGDWQPCANEGQTCYLTDSTSVSLIKYGYPDKVWYYREVQGSSFICNNDFFQDPLDGVNKFCYVLSNPTSLFVQPTGTWKQVASCVGCKLGETIGEGYSSTTSSTKTVTWSNSLSLTVKVGFEFLGASTETSVTSTISSSVAQAMSNAFSHSSTKSCSASCEPSGTWYMYQWSMSVSESCDYNAFCPVVVESCHWVCRNSSTLPACPLTRCANDDCSLCLTNSYERVEIEI